MPLVLGKRVIVRVWVKLGTATNFCMTFNNTAAWTSAVGKAFTTSDGLNTSTYTQIEFQLVGFSTNKFTINIGAHGMIGVAAQTAGTVFVYGWQMFVGDNNTTFNNTISCSGAKVGGNLVVTGSCTLPSNSLAISTVNALQTALDGKQATIVDSGLTIAKTNGLQAALDTKASLTAGAFTGNITSTGYMKSVPMCFFGRQLAPTMYSIGQKLKFTSSYDPYSRWDSANSNFTVSVAGYYKVSFILSLGITSGQYTATISILKNGAISTSFYGIPNYAANMDFMGMTAVQLVSGDYISLAVNQQVSGNDSNGSLVIELM
jgi:hypothetical protein